MKVGLNLVLMVSVLAFFPVALSGTEASAQDHHTAYFNSGSNPDGSNWMSPGENFSFTFNEISEYSYHCHPHPLMTGKIVVHAAPEGYEPTTHHIAVADDNSSRETPAIGYFEDEGGDSQTIVIVGDTVIWTNTGILPHTVTEGTAHNHSSGGHGDDAAHDAPNIGPVAAIGILIGTCLLRKQ